MGKDQGAFVVGRTFGGLSLVFGLRRGLLMIVFHGAAFTGGTREQL